jgi:hypothetical protein
MVIDVSNSIRNAERFSSTARHWGEQCGLCGRILDRTEPVWWVMWLVGEPKTIACF